MESTVQVEKDGKVSIIRMNVPNRLNSLDPILREDLRIAFRQFRDDPESCVAVLMGNGRAFSSGGDLGEIEDGMDPVFAVEHMHECNELITLVANITKPIIAAVHGACAGAGFSLAMACDLIVASSNSMFMQAFAQVGLVPDMGSTYFLPRAVGVQRAKELIFTARKVKAEEAQQLGIVSEVVAPEELESRVLELARKIADGPAFAIGLAKVLISRSLESNLQDMLHYEGLAQSLCLQSIDHKEGLSSFYEKRQPVFKGKLRFLTEEDLRNQKKNRTKA